MQRCNWISVLMNVGRTRLLWNEHAKASMTCISPSNEFNSEKWTRWKCNGNDNEWATDMRRSTKRENQSQMNVDCIKYDDVAIIYCHVNHIFLFMHLKTRSFNPPCVFIFTFPNTSYVHSAHTLTFHDMIRRICDCARAFGWVCALFRKYFFAGVTFRCLRKQDKRGHIFLSELTQKWNWWLK